MRTIVVLVGTRRVGKDTVANHLCERFGFVNMKFAGPVKEAVAALFDLTMDEVEGDAKDEPHPRWGVRPRELLQWFGTDVMREGLARLLPAVGQRFWIEKLRHRVLTSDAQRIVISDARFADEIECTRTLPGFQTVVIRLTDGPALAGGAPTDAHVSEAGVASLHTDFVVKNDGTLEDLYMRVATILRSRIV